LLCASATADDCGNPRQLALLNVRNVRAGVHSSAASGVANTRSIAKRKQGFPVTQLPGCPAKHVQLSDRVTGQLGNRATDDLAGMDQGSLPSLR